MTRITASSVSWGKSNITKNIASAALGNLNAYLFAAVLIVCSVAVGCSSDKPKPVTTNNQIPAVQPPNSAPTPSATPVIQAENKPAPKRPVVRKRPATVNYADKTYGVTFEYPRRYAIETGDAATQLVAQTPIPMNFVQPGGVALAAVSLPETNYTNTDFSSAFFNVSVNKAVSSDQCSEFAVPQPRQSMTSEAISDSSTSQSSPDPSKDSTKEVAKDSGVTPASESCHPEDGTKCGPKDPTSVAAATGADKPVTTDAKSPDANKLLIGDLELRATEAVSGEGTRQSDSKYFHIYQNGACYEFALNVTTDASEEGLVKHVDRDKVFTRLEQILSTVKISPVPPEVAAEAPAPAPQETPAQ
ncbi:MAG TPA: hypothetical protein VGG04_19645 [Candidatus Sulfotelmatobacter sp.]|jgi:hypothetical protein